MHTSVSDILGTLIDDLIDHTSFSMGDKGDNGVISDITPGVALGELVHLLLVRGGSSPEASTLSELLIFDCCEPEPGTHTASLATLLTDLQGTKMQRMLSSWSTRPCTIFTRGVLANWGKKHFYYE